MKNDVLIQRWLRRAVSNLARAKAGRVDDDILYEDLCFDIEQAVEKALKALCIAYEINFPHTHDISLLIDDLQENGVSIPDEITEARMLTNFAVETRYPGDYEPVTEEEYKKALVTAKRVYDWVLIEIESRIGNKLW